MADWVRGEVMRPAYAFRPIVRRLESVHTKNCIGNHRKIDEPRKDYVQLVISGKNLAEPLQAQKKALNLVPLFV